MRTYIFIILFTLSLNCVAETKLVISGLSKHVNHTGCISVVDETKPCTYNELNYGVGIVESTGQKSYYTAGVYKNSFSNMSTYIGFGYEFSKYSGIMGGAVTGYPMAMVVPSITPYLILPIVKRAELQFLMPFMPGATQVVAIQLRIGL